MPERLYVDFYLWTTAFSSLGKDPQETKEKINHYVASVQRLQPHVEKCTERGLFRLGTFSSEGPNLVPLRDPVRYEIKINHRAVGFIITSH